MAVLNLDEQVRKEYRNSATWAEQISNIAYALLWSFGTSISVVMK